MTLQRFKSKNIISARPTNLAAGKLKLKTRVKKSRRNANRKSEQNVLSENNLEVSTEGSLIPRNMRVVGMTPDGLEIVILITSNGQSKYYSLPVVHLTFGDKKPLAVACAETGFYDFADRAKLKRLSAELLQRGKTKKVIALSSSGVHTIEVDGKAYNAYVLGGKLHWMGTAAPIKVIVANCQKSVITSCNHSLWKEKVGRYLAGNPYAIVVAVHALSAALHRLLNQPSTSLSLVGESGIGKTTLQQSAQSQIGPIENVVPMSGTKVGIIENIVEHHDSPVFYEDSRQIDSTKIFIDILFAVADGARRMKSGVRDKEITGTLILSNERHIVDMLAGKSDGIDEGVFARFVEIDCIAPHGAFHNLHGYESGAAFASLLKQNSRKYYGAVWPVWIQVLSDNWPKVLDLYKKWLPKVMDKIAEQAGEAVHGRVNNRILDALSFSAWVGLIASHFKILPIRKREIVHAYGLVMKEYISRQLAGTTPLTDQLVSAVRGCLDENSGRFPHLSSFYEESQRSTVYGYRWKAKRHGELFLFLPNVFDRLFKEEYGSIVYKILEETGFLVITNSHGKQYQVRIPVTGQPKSFIAIKESIRFDQDL